VKFLKLLLNISKFLVFVLAAAAKISKSRVALAKCSKLKFLPHAPERCLNFRVTVLIPDPCPGSTCKAKLKFLFPTAPVKLLKFPTKFFMLASPTTQVTAHQTLEKNESVHVNPDHFHSHHL
jgi:hypothetical protein